MIANTLPPQKSLRVLVGCERSGRVRDAFRALGHDAVSCDIAPSEVPGPHIEGSLIDHDVIVKRGPWDLGIFFPDCTFLTVSANRWANEEWRMEARHWALGFVKTIWALPIDRIAIENPIGVLTSIWRRPTQIIHPWQFGHGEVKSTCLFLKNLPPLQPTEIVEGREPKCWKASPGAQRKIDRARTYSGVAAAMANQWGAFCVSQVECSNGRGASSPKSSLPSLPVTVELTKDL